jgi:hypothetical protein
MRRAAEREAVCEQAGPILANSVPFLKAAAEAVLLAFLAVGVVQIAPIPACERLVFVRADVASRRAFIGIGLGLDETVKRGSRELAGVVGVGRLDLRITNGGEGWL